MREIQLVDISVLKNTLESMASDAQDNGRDEFGVILTVNDAFEICRWKPVVISEWIPLHDGLYLMCKHCQKMALSATDFCPHCAARMKR